MRTIPPYIRPKADETTPSGVIILWTQRDESYLPGGEHYNHAVVVYPCCGKRKLQHNSLFTRYRRLTDCRCDTCRHKAVVQAAHPRWKGGVHMHRGYRYRNINSLSDQEQIFARAMTTKDYVLEHRIVMAVNLGRPLKRSEHVHHDNGKKSDNSPDNLVLMNPDKHASEHWKTRMELEVALKRIKKLEAQISVGEPDSDPAIFI